jgi:hypothetical protein
MTEPNLVEEALDFSLVLGGPIFQLFRRSHLAGDALEPLYRRLLIITLVAWLPLLLLSMLGNSYGIVREMRPVPFGLQDIARLAAATAALLVPLLLTILSPEELIMRIIKVVS